MQSFIQTGSKEIEKEDDYELAQSLRYTIQKTGQGVRETFAALNEIIIMDNVSKGAIRVVRFRYSKDKEKRRH